ncbi:hypothetical protein FQR65_LT17388 [Abscondita terminalis]|nr:hypothetical protein FQR65_LT17388 [Abscondita terminalis]
MDAEKLIIIIQERQSLWDQKSKQYSNRELNKKLWKEIGEKMNVAAESCASSDTKVKPCRYCKNKPKERFLCIGCDSLIHPGCIKYLKNVKKLVNNKVTCCEFDSNSTINTEGESVYYGSDLEDLEQLDISMQLKIIKKLYMCQEQVVRTIDELLKTKDDLIKLLYNKINTLEKQVYTVPIQIDSNKENSFKAPISSNDIVAINKITDTESHAAVLEHNEKPVKKYLLSRFIQNLNENQIRFVKASVTESSLMQKLNNLLVRDHKEAQRMYIEWNAETENILFECGIKAKQHKDMIKITTNRNYRGNRCENDKTADTTIENMPMDVRETKALLEWHESEIEIGRKNIYVGFCYNCGMLLFGDHKTNYRYKLISPQLKATVEERYENIPPNLFYKFDEDNWYTCKLCARNPEQVLKNFDIRNPTNGLVQIPKELEILTSTHELSDIALIARYYKPHTNRGPYKKRFVHHQGEINLISKTVRA